ncbi:unnamed protein product, partial [Dibothriocephalus latus]
MQKIFSLDTYLGPFLMRYLGKYVKLRDDQFELSLWGGDAVLNHVELQYDIFEHLIPLPIGFKSGQVHELRIHIPWTRLGSSSIVITLNTVECILALKKPEESNSRNRGPPPSFTSSPPATQDEPPPGYLQSYLNRILCNIQVVVNNLIVKFVEDTIVLSLNVRSLDCFPTSSNWIHGIPSLISNQNFCLYRLLKLTDLTLCMDESDAKGHIAAYQDPIVYRCNLEVRIQTVYSQKSYCFNNGLASLCIANLLCSNLDCHISQTQLPLIARLLEILLALAYGTLDWNALSTGWDKRSSRETSNVGASPSFDETSDEEAESEFGDFTTTEGLQSNNSAEYLNLIYESALENETYLTEVAQTTGDGESLSTTQTAGFSPSHIRENLQQKRRRLRRWRIRQLRAYQHKVPTLVLVGLVQKVTLNIKEDLHRPNILYLSPVRQAGVKASIADLFSCLFTDSPSGRPVMVHSVTTPQFPKVTPKLSACASNDAIAGGLLSHQSSLPPMTRAAYVKTFGEAFFEGSRPALWIDV